MKRLVTAALCVATALGCARAPSPASATASSSSTAAPSQDRLALVKSAADRIRSDDILRDVSYLGSDANMGRRTPFPGSPSPGYDSAAKYVAALLAQLGVKPMGDNGTYFQHYTVTRSTLDTARVTGAIGDEPIRWGDDFVINNFLVPGVREANVIYVGNGTRLLRQGVDPYRGFDIKGKWLLVNAALPTGNRGASGLGGRGPAPTLGIVGVDYTTINEVARHGGALGILLVPNPAAALAPLPRRVVTGQDLNPSVGVAYAQYQVPRVLLSVNSLRRLLAGTTLNADAVLNADSTRQYPASVELGANKRVRIDFAATTVEARPYNVVGMLEGSDARLKDEWISLAAHLDGAVPQAASLPGNNLPDQYNAADDNASGSAGNMAIVRALVAAPRPKRSILLIWDSGEEVGLWGTRTIAYGPWSEKLVLHVSNDMVGRSRPPNSPLVDNLSASDTIYVTGPKLLSTRIEANLQRAAREFPFINLDRVYEDISSEFYYPRTDAGPYLERGIPIMQFFNGSHPDYHRPTDDVAKLDIAKITAVSKLSFGALWIAADDPATPKWDGIVPHTLWWVTPRK
ncbi:MAG TPA: M28 family peptidase [Gemmatimonadaceae bacterium]|nr:M28 family peptidase [Gemmatimonadaceae bacterium]